MTRRNFIKQSIAGAAAFSLASPAIAQSATTLRLLTAKPTAAGSIADRITAISGGDLQIDTESVDAGETSSLIARVGGGEADMCLVDVDRLLDLSIAFGLFGAMPYGMTTAELTGWVLASDGRDMLDLLGERYGVTFYLAHDDGAKPMWSKEPFSDLAGLQGRVVGSSGLARVNLQQAGVGQVLDLQDPATDLSSLDVIDGMNVVDMVSNGLTDAFPYLMSANPNRPSSVGLLAVANGTIEGLSDGDRMLLERVCSAGMNGAQTQAFHDNATALSGKSADINIGALPDAVSDALATSAQSVLEMIFEAGNDEATMVDAYVYFLTDIAHWSEIGEGAFYTGRKRLLDL